MVSEAKSKPSKRELREFDRAEAAAHRASLVAWDASDPDHLHYNPEISHRLHGEAEKAHEKAAVLADILGFAELAELHHRRAKTHAEKAQG